jgi:hypothetical protein
MEYREGKGMILFCQMDVTARTDTDPAAQTLVAGLLRHTAAWKPPPPRDALYAGEQAGKEHLDAIGVHATPYEGQNLSPQHVLIVGPGAAKRLAPHRAAIAQFLNDGGRILAIALDQQDADAILPFKVSLKRAEYINAVFDPPPVSSPLAAIGPADVHNRRPMELPLLTDRPVVVGDVGNVVFDQLAPWQFDYQRDYGAKRTYRRASFVLTGLLCNLGVASQTPLLDRFQTPVAPGENRWLKGLYLDAPEEWDDPYRFFRW